MELDSSVTSETQLKIAPDKMPFVIIGTVTARKVFSFDVPRLMDASSMLIGICIRFAVAERIVYGIRRMTNEMIMMSIVPVSARGLLLNAMTSAMPITEPGIIYGIIEMESIKLFQRLERRTTRYAIKIESKIMTSSARPLISRELENERNKSRLAAAR